MAHYLGELLVERVLEGVGRGVVCDAAIAVAAVDGVGGADAGAARGAAETAVAADAASARPRGPVFAVRVCTYAYGTMHRVGSVHLRAIPQSCSVSLLSSVSLFGGK